MEADRWPDVLYIDMDVDWALRLEQEIRAAVESCCRQFGKSLILTEEGEG